ncbi:MAG: aminotransferase class I/II-fold pyridoxal phosphate-dependent enzyme [Bacteroidota bacterium]
MNQDSLDLEPSAFQQILEASKQLILEQYQDLFTQKAYHDFSQKEVASWFDETLPQQGMNPKELFAFVREKVLARATNNLGPHMYAYVMAGGNQISTIAESLATTVNQNVTKWHLAPVMTEIEKSVIRWTGEMLDLPHHQGGVMISGGSAANLTGLTVARNIFFEKEGIKEKGLFGMKPFVVYTSNQVHSCVDKSVQILGIGSAQLRKIASNAQFQIDLEQLERTIQQDMAQGYRPFCIVGTAGSVNTGAIDDLEGLAVLAQKYNMWFHIDGAYGGLCRALASQKDKYKGMEKADSIALDFHKWLYQPFEAGCTLVKDWDSLNKTYFKKAEYLETDLEQDTRRLEFNEHAFQLSRNAKAFKVWMSLKYYGFEKIRAMIQKDIDLTMYLAEEMEKSSDFEVKALSLAVLCFHFKAHYRAEKEILTLNQKLIPALEADGRVFITGTKLKGEFVIRACLINHRKTRESCDYLLRTIREVGKKIRL